MKRRALALCAVLVLSLLPLAILPDDSAAADCLTTRADPDAADNGRMTCEEALTRHDSGIAGLNTDLEDYLRDTGLGDASRAERCLAVAAATGKSVWMGESSNPAYCDNDPAKTWPDEQSRKIRASVLIWLLTDAVASKHYTRKGIGVGGAVVDGALDLKYAELLTVLKLNKCKLGKIGLHDAIGKTTDLSGSRIGLFDGTGLRLNGGLNLQSVYTPNEIDLTDAVIDGTLHVGDAHLQNAKDSLVLASARISESALFGGTYSNGMIRITRVTIDQDLNFSKAVFSDDTINGLKAGYAMVKGNFWWAPSKVGKHTELDLVGASVGTFHNSDKRGWPVKNCLFLHGFEFLRIDSPTNERTLKEWLDLQPDPAHDVQNSTKSSDACDSYQSKDSAYSEADYPDSQPFKELAAVLENSGKADDATELLIDQAQEDLDAEQAANPRSPKTWPLWLWGKVARFGYDPLHTIWFIVFFVILGWAIFWLGASKGLIVPTDRDAFEEYVKHDFIGMRRPPVYYQLFNSFSYSLETFFPLVDLFQAKNWLPNPQRQPRWASRLLRSYLWIHIIAGWFFTTALLAGLSGLFHK
jgi:hypothetical protein